LQSCATPSARSSSTRVAPQPVQTGVPLDTARETLLFYRLF
jgi:hypothetical protein